jgi:aspartyl-tRNA(Asn)/glutamyl-tRNA(Gln) amidotransferase subunit C
VILDKTDIAALSKLAKIAVNDNETQDYLKECSMILDFVQQIQSVNTDNIAPLSNPLEQTQRLREDIVTEGNMQAKSEPLSDHIDDHLYTVPKVID